MKWVCVGGCVTVDKSPVWANVSAWTPNVRPAWLLALTMFLNMFSSEAKHVYVLSTVAERIPQMTSAVSHGAETHKVHSPEARKGLRGLRACFPSTRPEFRSLAHTSWEWQQMP